jgi:tRNA (guanosine-2'-O-)-methyltransferase
MSTRRRKRVNTETFTPSPQSDEELMLAQHHTALVREVLGAMLTTERRETISRVVDNRTNRLHVAAEGVFDPHNTAAIIRSADAFGVQHVHIIEGAAKFHSSRSVTQGAHKWVDVRVYRDCAEFVAAMRAGGIRVLVAAMRGAVDVKDVTSTEPAVLVFGNESDGISPRMFELADGVFRIPMYGFVESFNVSVAASVAMSALRSGGGGDLSLAQKDVLTARYYLRSVRAGADIVRRALSSGR